MQGHGRGKEMVLTEKVNTCCSLNAFLKWCLLVIIHSLQSHGLFSSLQTSNVFNADAAHCNAGTLFRITTFDAAGHVVPVLQIWSAYNESTEMWSRTGEVAKSIYGGKLNDKSVVIVSDRDKELRKPPPEGRCHQKMRNRPSPPF